MRNEIDFFEELTTGVRHLSGGWDTLSPEEKERLLRLRREGWDVRTNWQGAVAQEKKLGGVRISANKDEGYLSVTSVKPEG